MNYISDILNFFGSSKLRKIDEVERKLKTKTYKYLQEMMKAYLEEVDEAIAQDKANRAKKGYVIDTCKGRRRSCFAAGWDRYHSSTH